MGESYLYTDRQTISQEIYTVGNETRKIGCAKAETVSRITHRMPANPYFSKRTEVCVTKPMFLGRPLKLHTHNAIVLAAAPLLLVGPYLLSFEVGIGFTTFAIGAILIGLTLYSTSPNRRMPLVAVARMNQIIGFGLVLLGVASAFAGQAPSTSIFLVGFGVAMSALNAATRYSARVAC
jgi:hypothetical protein